LARQPPVAHGLPIREVSRSHKTTHHSWWDSSRGVISSSHRPLPHKLNTHNRQISMPSVGFELIISEGERPQTHALDRAVNGTGFPNLYQVTIHRTKTETSSDLQKQTDISHQTR
jgi:hypothetical protein